MSATILISGAVFIGVALLVVAVASLMRDKDISQMEGRLNALTGKGDGRDPASLSEMSKLIAAQRGEGTSALDILLTRWFNLTRLFEQANVSMSTATFLLICGGLGFGAASLTERRIAGGRDPHRSRGAPVGPGSTLRRWVNCGGGVIRKAGQAWTSTRT